MLEYRKLCSHRLLWVGVFAFALTSGCKKGPEGSKAPLPAIPVVAAEVLVRDQPVYLESVAQAFGDQDVEIRARVAGFLQAVEFTEGRPVQRDSLLYRIDQRPFIASLKQAEGTLAQAMAVWEKAKADTNRFGPLWQRGAISRQQFDDAVAQEISAAANVKAATANVDSARIQLGYTEIYSPVDGLAGKNEVAVGNLVGQGQATLLTTISKIDPIAFRFSISEQDYLSWRRKYATAQDSSTVNQDIFELILADGSVHPHRGRLAFGDRQIDPTTGTLLLQVTFPNPDRLIRPGQFGRVRFPLKMVPQAVLIPQRAVEELQSVRSVYVLTPTNTVELRRIATGPRVESFYIAESGLKPGDRVVTDGIQKLRPGVPVSVTMTNLVLAPDRKP